MGAGASSDKARSTMSTMLSDKPADASDITDLEHAKREIIGLRKIARDFQQQLKGTKFILTLFIPLSITNGCISA